MTRPFARRVALTASRFVAFILAAGVIAGATAGLFALLDHHWRATLAAVAIFLIAVAVIHVRSLSRADPRPGYLPPATPPAPRTRPQDAPRVTPVATYRARARIAPDLTARTWSDLAPIAPDVLDLVPGDEVTLTQDFTDVSVSAGDVVALTFPVRAPTLEAARRRGAVLAERFATDRGWRVIGDVTATPVDA